MAFKIDFAPGLDAQRKREEIERAKANARQEEKKRERIHRREYKQAISRGDFRAARDSYDWIQGYDGTSGTGIKQAGSREGAISSRFDQTNSQLDSFSEQRRQPLAEGGRATNPDNQYQNQFPSRSNPPTTLAQSGKDDGVWVNAGGGPVSSAMSNQPTIGKSQSSAPYSLVQVGADPEDQRINPLTGMYFGANPGDAKPGGGSLSGRALAESNIATMGQEGAVADYFRRAQEARAADQQKAAMVQQGRNGEFANQALTAANPSPTSPFVSQDVSYSPSGIGSSPTPNTSRPSLLSLFNSSPQANQDNPFPVKKPSPPSLLSMLSSGPQSALTGMSDLNSAILSDIESITKPIDSTVGPVWDRFLSDTKKEVGAIGDFAKSSASNIGKAASVTAQGIEAKNKLKKKAISAITDKALDIIPGETSEYLRRAKR